MGGLVFLGTCLRTALLGLGLVTAALAVGSEPGAVVGRVVGFSGTVEVLPQGKGGAWKPVELNYPLVLGDVIRTGSSSRARLEFADRDPQSAAGPSVINLGDETELAVESFLVKFEKPRKSQGFFELIRGTIRAFTKGWSGDSNFSVRSGATVCGIRGSEQIVRVVPGLDGALLQTNVSGNVYTTPGARWGAAGERKLQELYQRTMPTPDPATWKDQPLSAARLKAQVAQSELPGNGGKTEDALYEETRAREGGRTGKAPPGGDGLPDCTASVVDLTLNHYLWDDIKQYRDFTFFKDELVDGRFVVSGSIKTGCPPGILVVEVSLDGGESWERARFSAEALTFRYEFDPAGYEDLDLRVRASFDPETIDSRN